MGAITGSIPNVRSLPVCIIEQINNSMYVSEFTSFGWKSLRHYLVILVQCVLFSVEVFLPFPSGCFVDLFVCLLPGGCGAGWGAHGCSAGLILEQASEVRGQLSTVLLPFCFKAFYCRSIKPCLQRIHIMNQFFFFRLSIPWACAFPIRELLLTYLNHNASQK